MWSLHLFWGVVLLMLSAQQIVGCVYNDTFCTCSYQASGGTCLRPSSDDNTLCESYTCASSYVCDCTGTELCSVSECSSSSTAYLPTSTISTSGLTSCTASSVAVCTVATISTDDSSNVSYNYTIVASGDFTVYSSGDTLSEVAVRAPKRRGASVKTGCHGLVIEVEYNATSNVEQGMSIAIQETSSDKRYVSGDSELTILVSFDPTGDYRSTDSFDYSSWKAPARRPDLSGVGSFSDAIDEFGAVPMALNDSIDVTANTESGTYVYYIELPFCEKTPRQSGMGPMDSDSGEPSEAGTSDETIAGNNTDSQGTNTSVTEEGPRGPDHFSSDGTVLGGQNETTPVDPVGFDTVGISNSELRLSEEDIDTIGLEVNDLPKAKFIYALTAADKFEVSVLGHRVDNGSAQSVLTGRAELPCVPVLIETKYDVNKSLFEMPGLALAITAEVNTSFTTFVSGSADFEVWVAVDPPVGYDDAKSGYNYSAFEAAVPMPSLSNAAAFGLMTTVYETEPVGPSDFAFITSDNGSMPAHIMPYHRNHSYVNVVYMFRPPTCESLYKFDEDGKPKRDTTFDDEYTEDNMYSGDGESVDTDDPSTSESNVPANGTTEVQTAELFSQEEVSGLGVDLGNIAAKYVGYAIVGSSDFEVLILGKSLADGSLWTRVEGFVDLPCVPVFVEMEFDGNTTELPIPAISVTMTVDPMGSRVNYVSGSNLTILAARNPQIGYRDPLVAYNFSMFAPAASILTPLSTGWFPNMEQLHNAVPVGYASSMGTAVNESENGSTMSRQFAVERAIGDETYESPNGNNSTISPPSGTYVFAVYPPCANVYVFNSTGGAVEVGRGIDPNETLSNGPIIGDEAETTKNETTKIDLAGFDNIGIAYGGEGLGEEQIATVGLDVKDLPKSDFAYALTVADEFDVFVLGIHVENGSAENVLVGQTEQPCVPILVESRFDARKSHFETPGLSLAITAEVNESEAAFVSGKKGLQIWVAVNPPSGYKDATSEYNYSIFEPAVVLPSLSNKAAFGLMANVYEANPVGPRIFPNGAMRDFNSTDLDIDPELNNSFLSVVYVIRPPDCENMFTFDVNGSAKVGKVFVFEDDLEYSPMAGENEIEGGDGDRGENPGSGTSTGEGNSSAGETSSMFNDAIPAEPVEYGNVSISYSEENMPVDEIDSLGLNSTGVRWSNFTYALTAADDFEVFVLGRQLSEGSAEVVLMGSTMLPCVPILVETKHNATKSVVERPGLSMAITGVINETITTRVTRQDGLVVRVAVNPPVGYNDPKSAYNFSAFERAVAVNANSTAFSVMSKLYDAVPVGPSVPLDYYFMDMFAEMGSNETFGSGTDPDVDEKSVMVVYAIHPPTCERVYMFNENGAPQIETTLVMEA